MRHGPSRGRAAARSHSNWSPLSEGARGSSAFNAAALALALTALRGGALWRGLRRAPWPVWVSGLCWAVMFTAFMVALTLTSVASVLITMAVAPLMTALLARLVLGHRLAPRTWASIGAASGTHSATSVPTQASGRAAAAASWPNIQAMPAPAAPIAAALQPTAPAPTEPVVASRRDELLVVVESTYRGPRVQADAPTCASCGWIMTRSGTCYRCENCGSTSGCS